MVAGVAVQYEVRVCWDAVLFVFDDVSFNSVQFSLLRRRGGGISVIGVVLDLIEGPQSGKLA